MLRPSVETTLPTTDQFSVAVDTLHVAARALLDASGMNTPRIVVLQSQLSDWRLQLSQARRRAGDVGVHRFTPRSQTGLPYSLWS